MKWRTARLMAVCCCGAAVPLRCDALVPLALPQGSTRRRRRRLLQLQDSPAASSPEDRLLQRTKDQLHRLQQQQPPPSSTPELDERKRDYLQQSANALKALLASRRLPQQGRKPDLAARLAAHDLQILKGLDEASSTTREWIARPPLWQADQGNDTALPRITSFAGLQLSPAAAQALAQAQFTTPTPIQQATVPGMTKMESLLLHAATGSGKTLAYLLPLTERLWRRQRRQNESDEESVILVVLTPTRELATQVAGIASVLAPPGAVQLVTQPQHLMRQSDALLPHRLIVGSARAIQQSLYGDGPTGRWPAAPTPKPLAMQFLQNVQTVVLDEVDRLLLDVARRGRTASHGTRHEKPAAIVTAAVTRATLGRAQVVAASATVGRPLRRELARVLGLPPQSCPRVVVGEKQQQQRDGEHDGAENVDRNKDGENMSARHHRAVTIPSTVQHYILPVPGTTSSPGQLLVAAYQAIQAMPASCRILMVLSRSFGMNTQNVLGALRHFDCRPRPQSLIDLLEGSGGDNIANVMDRKDTTQWMEQHRHVSGATGIGESIIANDDADQEGGGYLLVTGEDSIRGLHLDRLDVVLVLGHSHGPDEYTHIAGRTGRAGHTGAVLNVVHEAQQAALESWESMLDIEFVRVSKDDLSSKVQWQGQKI